MGKLQDRMVEELQLGGYSPATIVSYTGYVRVLARYYRRSPAELSLEEVRQFLLHLLNERKVSSATFNGYCYGLRFFYRNVLGYEELWPKIAFQRLPRKLPQVLSRQEVAALLGQASNIRHRAMLSTLYATGVRVGELTHLQVSDIDSKRMVVRVNRGKGNKDRNTLLPPELLSLLRDYWRVVRPKHCLFPGRYPGRPVFKDAAGRALKRCRDRAGISKPATPHTLRHSFRTCRKTDGCGSFGTTDSCHLMGRRCSG